MAPRADSFYSIRMARFLMELVGFWIADDKKKDATRKIVLFYTIIAITIAMMTTAIDFYFSFDDFYGATYAACALMPVVLCLVKISGFIFHRSLVMEIIRYTQDNFWNADYDDFGDSVLRDTDRKGILLICSFTFFVSGTVVCYIATPVMENIGKNDSERILAFNVWLNIPSSETPYYEIFAVTQVTNRARGEAFSCAHAGVCFCCFDNFFCMLNIHAAAQFKILQNRIAKMCNEDAVRRKEAVHCRSYVDEYSNVCYEKLKKCVRQHQALIGYVEDVEKLFTFLVLGQLLVSSVMVCVAGFQVARATGKGRKKKWRFVQVPDNWSVNTVRCSRVNYFLYSLPPVSHPVSDSSRKAEGTIVRRMIFVAHTIGSIFQLLVITSTANEVIVESVGIADAAYSVDFNALPYDNDGKKLREDLVMMMIRARKPCCITAGRFFPVSLETFTKVSTTSMSYFTMLRQMEEDIGEI